MDDGSSGHGEGLRRSQRELIERNLAWAAVRCQHLPFRRYVDHRGLRATAHLVPIYVVTANTARPSTVVAHDFLTYLEVDGPEALLQQLAHSSGADQRVRPSEREVALEMLQLRRLEMVRVMEDHPAV